ncbi:SDR family oxidoreductase [Anaeromyxobacter sp. Fw109-5]|uniref:SDR family oxidoreductase n=1 Tax=Anaeromyxobacter sp. (strain Fw109-5) TaxID=404589 RepID=UPI001F2C1DEB|nr:SDR family oxidoreductase [Anaeromyxobacter sp. Fw109-5]
MQSSSCSSSRRAPAAAYTVAKTAVVALARALAVEVLDAGVRVNAVLPSTIDTAANRRAMPDGDAARWVQPESLAAVIGVPALGRGARCERSRDPCLWPCLRSCRPPAASSQPLRRRGGRRGLAQR